MANFVQRLKEEKAASEMKIEVYEEIIETLLKRFKDLDDESEIVFEMEKRFHHFKN